MAADGDCPSQFLGQPWSVWTDHLSRDSPVSDEEEPDRKTQTENMRLPREGIEEVHRKPVNVTTADGDCPSRFLGQPWSVWTEHLGRESPISDEEPETKPHADAMRLRREDMGLFGYCPERDPFYAVVCNLCNAIVKPQGMRYHMDIWHKVSTLDAAPVVESNEKSSKVSVVPKSGLSTKPNSTNVKIKLKEQLSNNISSAVSMERLLPSNQDSNGVATCGNSILSTDGIVALTKGGDKILLQTENSLARNQTAAGGPVSLQPVVALTPLSSSNDIATIMTLAFQSVKGTVNTTSTSSNHNHSVTVMSGEQVSHSQRLPGSPQKKRLKSDRLPVKEREYDPDKHCGVWNEESNKPCTRSLTCKTHSMSMRRAVSGRSKHFDKLLADHRAAKEVAGKLNKTLGIVQVSGLDGDGGQLLSPVAASTNAVPMAELPTCVVALPNLSPGAQTNGIQTLGSDPQSPSYPATTLPSPAFPPSSTSPSASAAPPVGTAELPPSVVTLPTPLSMSPDGQTNGVQTSSSDPQSPSYPPLASPPPTPPPPTVLDLAVDTFEPIISLPSLPSESVLTPSSQYAPGACHLPRPPEEFAALKFILKLEEVTWLRSHPKPVTVCSFSSRKLGGVVANNRRVELFCHGLKTALKRGCIRFPRSKLRTAKDKVLAVRHEPVVAKRVVFRC